jgi:hypothetical protein
LNWLRVRGTVGRPTPTTGWKPITGAQGSPATDAQHETDQSARIIIAGHAFIQNIRRGHYELGVDEPMTLRVVAAFDELALAI